jgi:hypothetical protein
MVNDHVWIVFWCSNNDRIFGNLGSFLNQKTKFKTAPFRSESDRHKIVQVKLKKKTWTRPNLGGARNLTHTYMRTRSNTYWSRSLLFLKSIVVQFFFQFSLFLQ